MLVAALVLAPQALTPADYIPSETRIKARDGVELLTVVHRPRNQTAKLPILILRTPYDARGYGLDQPFFGNLVRDGYIFAFQDIRGKNNSGGKFVMMRPMRKDPKGVDEATDAWDTVDWLVKNVPDNNGRAGMLGVSYDGWTALCAGLDPHPALKAVSPQAAPVDMWINDDFHRNGAFRLTYGFEYAYAMEKGAGWTDYPFPSQDLYGYFLKLGPLSRVDQELFKGTIPTWTGFTQHPNHDAYWRDRSTVAWMKRPKIPFLIVAGWWDQEDPIGPKIAYDNLSQSDPEGKVRLVVGPWNHGGWGGEGRRLGALDFGSATGVTYRDWFQKPFFDHYLKDIGKLDENRVAMFRTGVNRWERYPKWQPRRPEREGRLFLAPKGRLTFVAPASNGFESFVSDPANPVPYRPTPVEPTYSANSKWGIWQTLDQRFLADRKDVLTWQTEPLEQDVTLTGNVLANLRASTSGTDADWVVKLIDVAPDGYQLTRNAEVVRARFRAGGAKPKPVPSNRPVDYRINLHWTDHTFRKGHRIMVQVQSSWFPVIDRNPQRYVPNIFEAKPTDFVSAEHRVFHGSFLEVARASRP